MTEAGVEANCITHNTLINVSARLGDIARAESWLSKMQAAGLEAVLLTYNSLINACAKAGDIPRAEWWFDEMVRNSLEPDAVSYSTVIHACQRAHDAGRAERWLVRMHEDGHPPNAFCHNSVVQALCQAEQLAMDAGLTCSSGCFGSTVSLCIRKRRLKDASWWLQKMEEQGHSTRNFQATLATAWER